MKTFTQAFTIESEWVHTHPYAFITGILNMDNFTVK